MSDELEGEPRHFRYERLAFQDPERAVRRSMSKNKFPAIEKSYGHRAAQYFAASIVNQQITAVVCLIFFVPAFISRSVYPLLGMLPGVFFLVMMFVRGIQLSRIMKAAKRTDS